MRKKLVLLPACLALLVAMAAGPVQGAPARGGASKPFSPEWLASNHTRYDNALTAAYETRLAAMNGKGSSLGSALAPTNIRMSNANFAGNQNEFQIDINPINPRYAVGVSNDGRSGGVGSYRTADFGATWIPMDMFPNLASCCDPGVAYADDGTVYVIALDLSPAVVHMFKSTNNGMTWALTTDVPVVDRPNITIDNNPASPFHGRIYLTWSKLDFSPYEIELNYSDNQGASWTGPINVSHVNGSGAVYPQSSNPHVAADGTVYVGFQFYPGGTNDSAVNRIAKSTNGGVSFATSTIITAGPNVQAGLDLSGDARGYFAVNGSCATFRHRAFPIIKSDPSNSSTVYALWAGGNLELPYTCGSLHGVHGDVLFSRSVDGGATWSAPLKVNDDPEGKDQYYPWMDVSANGKITVGWHDRRNDANNYKHVWYQDVSTDGGLTFGIDRRIGTFQSLPDTFIGDYAGLASVNQYALPMWWDSRNSSTGDPYTARTR